MKPSAPANASAPTPRWRIVLAGFLLALMGGMSYAWGVLVLPLMDRFGWSKAEAALPFTVFLVVFALAMVPAGRLQDRLGRRAAVLRRLRRGGTDRPCAQRLVAGGHHLLAARLLRNPPEGWSAPGASPASAAAVPALDLSPSQMARTARFWIIWLAFGAVISGGLVAIGLVPAYGRAIGLDSAQAALAISVFAAFNGFGRPLGSLLADRHGVLPVMLATYAVQAVVLLGFPHYAQTLPALYTGAALLGWSFAVTLGLFPVLTASCFGVSHLGVNYGLVFTAFGAGALVPLWASWLHDRSGSYGPAFVAAGVLAVLGLVLCIVLRSVLSRAARSARPVVR